ARPTASLYAVRANTRANRMTSAARNSATPTRAIIVVSILSLGPKSFPAAMTSSAFAIRFRLKNFLPAWIVNHARILLAAILLIGLLIRLPFAAIDFHNSADLRLYMDWAKAARTSGLAAIYSVPSLDYPPLFLYFLAV